MLLAIYTLTIIASASLLFSVQPMIGKTLLPLLGGAPAVWNTCMVFYQAVLLTGYAYAHFSTSRFSIRRQTTTHLVLVAFAILLLPIGLPRSAQPPTDHSPILWLLGTLTLTVGLPLFVLSTTAPILQRWFADTDHKLAKDPYFLYAGSNAGSLASLLAYPVFIERFPLATQRIGWSFGYVAFALLLVTCAFAAGRYRSGSKLGNGILGSATTLDAESMTRRRRAKWMLLSLLPSSWMFSVTQHITTDLAPIPLLWIVPLALYLFTFILVFSRFGPKIHAIGLQIFPLVIALLCLSSIFKGHWALLFVHLAGFLFGSLLCHGELAKDRPSTARLTEYYLCMSIGGVLGGAFNAILAPVIFPLLFEYPIAVFLVCLVRPTNVISANRRSLLGKCLLLAITLAIALLLFRSGLPTVSNQRIVRFVEFGSLAMILLYWFGWRVLFACLAGSILGIDISIPSVQGNNILTERSFFGVHRVLESPVGKLHLLMHGSTIHGLEDLSTGKSCLATTYYHKTGPLGEVFGVIADRSVGKRIGVIGLGAGTIAAYPQTGRHFVFFEIDPAVQRIAEDPKLFLFLKGCDASYEIKLGDGRLNLDKQPDGSFGILVLDAFASDAIPIHLLTLEAVRLYFEKLSSDGMLVCNISNNYANLLPVFAKVANECGLVCLYKLDADVTLKAQKEGKYPSKYVILARDRMSLLGLDQKPGWELQKGNGKQRCWTDDSSNVLEVLDWKRE